MKLRYAACSVLVGVLSLVTAPTRADEVGPYDPIDKISGTSFLAVEAAVPEFLRLVSNHSVADYKISVYPHTAGLVDPETAGLDIVFIDAEAPEDTENLGDPGRPEFPGYVITIDVRSMKVVSTWRLE